MSATTDRSEPARLHDRPDQAGRDGEGEPRDAKRPADPGEEIRPGARRLAEWVTMALSAVVVLGVGGYMAYQALHEQTPYAATEVRPLLEQAREQDGRYILPVEVKNNSRRTLRDLQVRVAYRTPDGKDETRDFKIDYLGELATQVVYLYFDHPPQQLRVTAKPLDYRLN